MPAVVVSPIPVPPPLPSLAALGATPPFPIAVLSLLPSLRPRSAPIPAAAAAAAAASAPAVAVLLPIRAMVLPVSVVVAIVRRIAFPVSVVAALLRRPAFPLWRPRARAGASHWRRAGGRREGPLSWRGDRNAALPQAVQRGHEHT